MTAVPLGGLDPLQPPEAMQPSADVALHAKVVPPPGATLAGFGAKVMVGFSATATLPLVCEEPNSLLQAARATSRVAPSARRKFLTAETRTDE